MKSEMETEVADTDEAPVWFMERVYVQLKENEQQAVIKEVNAADKSALVELPNSTTQTVRVSEVSMVPPAEHDTVLVTGGNEVGLEGLLVCVDGKFIARVLFLFLKNLSLKNIADILFLFPFFSGSDAILKDAKDEFKIIDFVHLVKIASES